MNVTVERSRHGPFERIVLSYPLPATLEGHPSVAALSVYRVGDILIDTGSTRTADALVRALADTPPQRVVLTHQHEDHAGGVNAVKRAFGDLPVHCPRSLVDIVRAGAPVPPHRELFWGHPEPVEDLLAYDPGHTFETWQFPLHTLATPGHSPGHVALYTTWGDHVYACTGDLFFSRRMVPAWFESAADDMARSQRAVADLGPRVVMLPTHGRVRDEGGAFLRTNADAIDHAADAVRDTAAQIGRSDLAAVTRAHFEQEDVTGALTGGEISLAAFTRSVLEPVRALPATSLAHLFAG